jgi:hypothetical protein
MMSDLPENQPVPPSGAPARRKGRGILCAKCEHLNPSDLTECEYCEDPLHMNCPQCNAVNARVLTQCVECRSPLHRTLANRFRRGGDDSKTSKGDKAREPAVVTAPGKGILCSRCEHLNPDGIESCEHCDEPLFANCPACSARNNRAVTNCKQCRSPLVRSLKDRLLGVSPSQIQGKAPAASSTDAVGEAGKGILCAKCDHLNPLNVNRCEVCHGHLYIVCRDCNHTNARILQRCTRCDRRLHRSLHDRDRAGEARPLNLIYAIVALVAFVIAGIILVKMSGLRLFK